jgi:hypothetical protein
VVRPAEISDKRRIVIPGGGTGRASDAKYGCAVDAMQQISTGASWSGPVNRDVGVILAFTVSALAGRALTLRRRPP